MAEEPAKTEAHWPLMRSATPARIGLARTGSSMATQANLDFQLAHAQARDAVGERVNVESLVDALRPHGLEIICVSSAARDRRSFLLRPDLGRKLDELSRARLTAWAGEYDIAFVIADGLSARAIMSHASPMIDVALRAFSRLEWKIGPVVIVENGRVAIGDEIGELLGAALVVMMIGERPGLTSPDSLGLYLTFAPRVGRTDAERNCVSNIRAEGMPYEEAARKLTYLCHEARRRKLTGVMLKDESSNARAIDKAPKL
jgi:ethanolamine ammonia-lyase small subunit